MTKGERKEMASKGYGNLWIMAIALIAVFIIATVIAPELTGHGQTSSDNGWNTDMPSGEAIFYAPTTTLSASGLEVNKVVDFSVYARSVANTTGKGGIYAWIFQLEGANSQLDLAQLKYDSGASSVVWSPGSNGAIIGVGPRFIQGPGAVSMDVSSSLSLALTQAGKYTLDIWIATSSSTTDIKPGNYTSVSPMVKITITTAQSATPQVSMSQSMSVPSTTVQSGEWNDFSTMTSATGTGGWSDPVDIYIAIAKKNIGASDVSLRVSNGNGYSNVSFTDQGDKLVAVISSTTPLTGSKDPESTSWTTSFQLSFNSTGTYVLTSWAKDSSTGKDLTISTYDSITVQSHVVIPPTPTEPNSTNTTNGTSSASSGTAQNVSPSTNSTAVEQAAATNGTNKSNG